MINKAINLLKTIKIKQFSLKLETCVLCNGKLQMKLCDDEMSIRCCKCMATPVAQMMGKVFLENLSGNDQSVYELSSRGAFVRFLKKQDLNLKLSEYFENIENGTIHNGVICQNVEELTFETESFDICTSLEVFEHVEDDLRGFKEIHRVLKKDGVFIFTVPIDLNSNTIERTKVSNGKRVDVLPKEFHSDSILGKNKVFCYRNYGIDIIDRLYQAGFSDCTIQKSPKCHLFGFGRPVIIAKK